MVLQLLLNVVLGGALIVFGVFIISSSAEKKFHNKKSLTMQKADGFASFFFASLFLTAILQSSSAVTVLTVGLMNAGVLCLRNAMAVIYGANIGTTATAYLMSLDLSGYFIYILTAGLVLRSLRHRFAAAAFLSDILISVGLIFAGIKMLNMSVSIINGSEYVQNFVKLYSGSSPACFAFGFITTALVHSSSATTGITIALFNGGIVGAENALAILLGENIGTCLTAQIAALAANENGRRAAWGHTIYNSVCGLLFMAFLPQFSFLVQKFTSLLGQTDSFLVANAHMLFNVMSALLFIPINGAYCNFLELIIRDESRKSRKVYT